MLAGISSYADTPGKIELGTVEYEYKIFSDDDTTIKFLIDNVISYKDVVYLTGRCREFVALSPCTVTFVGVFNDNDNSPVVKDHYFEAQPNVTSKLFIGAPEYSHSRSMTLIQPEHYYFYEDGFSSLGSRLGITVVDSIPEDYTPPAAQPADAPSATNPADVTPPVTTPAEVPATPAISLTAKPTSSTVFVDGRNIAFDAYEIEGYNYFKLRDLAYVLNGSTKQFEVEWDDENDAIALYSGMPYTEAGGEMTGKGAGIKTPEPTNSYIYLNYGLVQLTAYNIEGNNYFKLRDIGEKFNFGVDWDGDLNAITIATDKGYGDTEAPSGGIAEPKITSGGTSQPIVPPGDNTTVPGLSDKTPWSPGPSGYFPGTDDVSVLTYLDNFPTVPYVFDELGVNPDWISALVDTDELVVYAVDYGNTKYRGDIKARFEIQDDIDQMLYDCGFENIPYTSTEADLWNDFSRPSDHTHNSYTGVFVKDNVKVILVISGRLGPDTDFFIASY